MEKVSIEFPPDQEINKRLATVLKTLYLLFNEGYYSETNDIVLREDLCLEAMRLCYLLVENEATNQPEVNALLALMCFHASRFKARKNEKGEMVLYNDQDKTVWNEELINKGVYFLHQASGGKQLSTYHLEAAIAYWHTTREDKKEKWENIVQLYDHLLRLQYSSIAALNRAYAVSKVHGKQAGINEAEQLQLTKNHYYFALLAELYKDIDDEKSRECFQKALQLAKTTTDKQTIQSKLRVVDR
jgi:RNA polymerase sigma-70 factor (ECF subfamily)